MLYSMDKNPDWNVFLNMATTNYSAVTPVFLQYVNVNLHYLSPGRLVEHRAVSMGIQATVAKPPENAILASSMHGPGLSKLLLDVRAKLILCSEGIRGRLDVPRWDRWFEPGKVRYGSAFRHWHVAAYLQQATQYYAIDSCICREVNTLGACQALAT